jgi:elongation factor 3
MLADHKTRVSELLAKAKDTKQAADALGELAQLAAKAELESVLVTALPQVIEAIGDKQKPTQAAATQVLEAVVSGLPAWSAVHVLPSLMQGMSSSMKPAQKEASLKVLAGLAKSSPKAVGRSLVDLIPLVSGLIWDAKKDVKAAAVTALESICYCSGNDDIAVFVPQLSEAIQNPELVPETVEGLAGCVFVQEVEAAALAITTPVLLRGLNGKTDVKRKCCIIIENMCKLVNDSREVAPLLKDVKPQMELQKEGISDPEARSVAERAFVELCKVAAQPSASVEVELATVEAHVAAAAAGAADEFGVQAYVAKTGLALTQAKCWAKHEWVESFRSLGAVSLPVAEIAAAVLEKCQVSSRPKEIEWDTEGVDLYKGEFGLAYGALTLLNTTRLQLKRNRLYGLLGPNNCGKTTLMRAIEREQIEGFPKRDELRTIFVEHEIQEREVGEDEEKFPILNIDLSGIDWVVDACNNVYHVTPPVTREQVAEVMEEIGFGNSERGTGKDRAADAAMKMTTFSGGWKVKMQLCAATLVKADVLMLDEPTGHLDVTNIAWIMDWLSKFMESGGSVIATSHDTGFLNQMCTDIIDFQDRKLHQFRGTPKNVLTEFVEKYPEKKGYFELKNDVTKFEFPKPGPLAGVKSLSKALVKLSKVTFQYPTRDTPTIFDVDLQASRVSRVAVIGANGAGKSTAIKVLLGELKATGGEVYRHPELRLAYVAQHAFQHLEKHLRETPTQYILQRFAGNDDQEAIDFKANNDEALKESEIKQFYVEAQTNKIRPCEEKKHFAMAIEVDAILARREDKKEKTKQYQCKLKGKSVEESLWIDRIVLVKMGHLKKVQRQDEKEAMAAGLQSKALTSEAVEKHLLAFGLSAEVASHSQIHSLSGGQKVKVVLGASMWQNPHILVLDEPTNYLDRDGLGALTLALKEWEGGVIIISHNKEFCDAVATEKWIMKAGNLRQEGSSEERGAGDADKSGNKEKEDVFDQFGNKVDMADAEKDAKKLKKELKELEKQIKDNKKKKILSQDEVWELEDRIAVLKEKIGEKK